MHRPTLALLLCAACGSPDADPGTDTGTDADSDDTAAATSTSSAGTTQATTAASPTETAADATTAEPDPTSGTTAAESTGDDQPCDDSPQALADCVEAQRWQDDLAFIADIRTPGSPHWLAVQDLCAERLDEYGYEVELYDYGTGVDVVGRRLGKTAPDQQVLVGAHYDHIAGCHGADDNASGLAAALEIARVLALAEYDRTIIVACWDEEEDGLVGSQAFIGALGSNQVVIDFNFDMIGVRSDEPGSQSTPPGFELVFADVYAELQAKDFRGDFIAIITSDAAKDHALAHAAAADRIGLPRALLPLPAGGETSPAFADLRRSDHAAFWDAGWPAIFITDTGDFRNDHYHCMGGPDEVADLDLDFAADVTRATVEASALALGM